MMRYVIIGAVAILLLLALIIGAIYLIPRLFPQTPPVVPTPTPTPIVIIPTPTTPPGVVVVTPTPSPDQFDIYNGPGFTLPYPQSWGILTCNNSQNFEFDPNNNVDQLRVTCGVAVKPISVIVQNNLAGCSGETVNIGGINTIRSTTPTSEFTLYQWCTTTQPVLRISHRVSPSSTSSAVSPVNYSADIETIIANARFSTI